MTEEEKQELEWLRYFYDKSDRAIGPAYDDVVWAIQENYKEQGGVIPEEYDLGHEE